ncbi:hypothetical protein [Polaribacter sargassicola]|uniref:hypothetical protein n=1 Tax=Polaribacter sargassicola TaxID=2836891 RepID=UPI001F1B071D|nr:hypothetical protein [Polaribacter sp. DS7-9]MCG1037344.1 hypothetical protein [Polaribacter sp. DS7-9]
MSTKLFTIKHFNNSLDVFDLENKIYSSKWFMDFGKMGAEVFNADEEKIYFITKKFKFWKWKMVFTIKDTKGNLTEFTSQNNKKTIYSIDVNEITYELKIHHKKKKSIFKNRHKIAEFDESFIFKDPNEPVKVQLLDKKDLEICFLLFSCLKIGDTELNGKSILASQKQLEPNEDPWS